MMWTGSAVFALSVLVTAASEFAGVGWADSSGVPSPLWTVWIPTAVGIPLIWLLTPDRGPAALDKQVRQTLGGHPVSRELSYLMLCLAGFLVGAVLLGNIFAIFHDDGVLNLGTPVSRVAFLLIIPVLMVDRAGLTLSRVRGSMPRLAIGVREPWRWSGLVAVTVVLGIVLLYAWEDVVRSGPAFSLVLLLVLLVVTVPEEIFFRGMVQTRLEGMLGRGAGIVLASLMFAFVYATLGSYVDLLRLGVQSVGGDYLLAVATYGVAGLLYGYLWSHYRNIWLNVGLRAGTIALVLGPSLALAG
ncbi:hypothetical protein Nans01_18870 [Nocardiopsis ansamitocini]|uniref:CAAX prenyl protease 2/Lysostaphin resistance protein A-like domain-containing protein n=1 Tax=Nocardiopsis ansamitocini TaxID=1670832 RepID=A0A9W6UGI5_9ACTN|nr:hypothetical protein Nans01_18870 [Nocardiopsis ansamitocini]